jgi:phage terminase large subunit-like protein
VTLPRDEAYALIRYELERRALLARYDWLHNARPSQALPAGDWTTWLILAGRGFGKTRTGAETVRAWSEEFKHIGLIGRTIGEARDLMIEGRAGLLHVFPDWNRPQWVASKRLIRFPSGAQGHVFTSDEPDLLRGPEHQKIWADETASWVYPQTTWDMAMLGLRVPPEPQVVVTTTPKPIPLIKDMVKRAKAWAADDLTPHDREQGRVVISTGSTHENAANLDRVFLANLLKAYEGTRLGRQEIEAEVLDDRAGAMWGRELIAYRDPGRIDGDLDLARAVVAIDPAATSGESSDETGIVAAGLGHDGLGYVIDDRSLRGSPAEWAGEAVRLYHRIKADRIVAEANNGGEMVEHTIRTVDSRVPVRLVHASRGKRVRAEPIAAKYEQHRVFHVEPLPLLEDQMTSWVPSERGRSGDTLDVGSPDRVDALVWALTDLLLDDVWGPVTGSGIA